ncbi:MAG: response regulator [Bacilli bacterium]|nr:response regulator [Bacilli bacterium]
MNNELIQTEYPTKKVVIIDDDNLNLKILGRILEKYKIDFDSLTSGYELLEKIEKGNKYDLIISDDMMPNMSGTQTLQKLKQNSNFNIPTVVLTANTVDGAKEEYLSAGFNEYMGKPINREELNNILNKYLS